MPETITREITVYTFDELSDRAKERAMQDWVQVMDFDPDYIIDDFKEQGRERGFVIEHIQWEGFGGRSDCAVWQGSVEIGDFIDYHLKPDNPHYARYVVLRELYRDGWLDSYTSVAYRGYRYTQSVVNEETSIIACESVLKGASVRDLAKGIDYEDLLTHLHGWIEMEVKAYESAIFKALEEEYEWECSHDHFTDLAEANEWRFDETGKIV